MSIITGKKKIFHFSPASLHLRPMQTPEIACESAARFTRGGVLGIKVSISIVIG